MMDLETKEIPIWNTGIPQDKTRKKNRSEKTEAKEDKTPKISSKTFLSLKGFNPQIEIAKGQYSARGDWNNVLVEEVIQNFLWRILWRQYRI